MNKLIELKNLTKNFEDQQVLRGINLDVYENEFLTLLGPSGCGKTTTLRIIAGFEEPSDGQVLFNGIEISKVPPYKREVNTVFQKYALFPHMNVFENIAFGLNIKKMDKNVIRQKVERMLRPGRPGRFWQPGCDFAFRRTAAAGSHCQGFGQ